MVKEVQNKMGKQLKFVFRHFPIASLHEHAQTAAEAAECAGVQGKFWEMHDMLFQNYKTLDDDHLMHFAGHLELDIEKFEQDMENHIGKEHVHEDFTSGVRSGVNGTPTFFINGVRYDGDYDADSIVKALKEAIKAK